MTDFVFLVLGGGAAVAVAVTVWWWRRKPVLEKGSVSPSVSFEQTDETLIKEIVGVYEKDLRAYFDTFPSSTAFYKEDRSKAIRKFRDKVVHDSSKAERELKGVVRDHVPKAWRRRFG